MSARRWESPLDKLIADQKATLVKLSAKLSADRMPEVSSRRGEDMKKVKATTDAKLRLRVQCAGITAGR